MCRRTHVCVIGVAVCLTLAAAWTLLAVPEDALAKKPGGGGGGGNAPVCCTFPDVGGVYNDGGGPYCDNGKDKIEAIMTPDGHLNLLPNTSNKPGAGAQRILYVLADLGEGLQLTDAWRFGAGWFRDDFDMRAMAPDEQRTDVNLNINTTDLDYLVFNPAETRHGLDYSQSTYATVRRVGSDDVWEVEIGEDPENPDQAVRVGQNEAGEWVSWGVVTVPPFKATVRFK